MVFKKYSLQTDLFTYRHDLAEDGYYAGGRFYDPFVSGPGKFIQNRLSTPLLDASKEIFKNKFCPESKAECVDRFKKELEPFRGKHHVILSDEGLAKVWNEKPGAYEALHSALSDDWKILIVSAYRHFFEWVPSFRYQLDRLDTWSKPKTLWPGEGEGTDAGRELTPLFPEETRAWLVKSHTFPNSAIEASRGIIPVKVFDMNKIPEGTSVRTYFFCEVVPDATKTCERSRAADRLKTTDETVMNSREKATHASYDMLTTAAARRGWIDKERYSRKPVREAMRDYNENVLNATYRDFERICPNSTELELWLDGSLDRQRGSFGDSFTEEMEREHRDSFQKMVDSKEFCHVNVDAVLSMDRWREFFRQYAPGKSE